MNILAGMVLIALGATMVLMPHGTATSQDPPPLVLLIGLAVVAVGVLTILRARRGQAVPAATQSTAFVAVPLYHASVAGGSPIAISNESQLAAPQNPERQQAIADKPSPATQTWTGAAWEAFKAAIQYDFFLPLGVVGKPASAAKRALAGILGAASFFAAVGLYKFTFNGPAIVAALAMGLQNVISAFAVPLFWIVLSAVLLLFNDRKADFANAFRTAFLLNIFLYTVGKLYSLFS